MASGLLSAGAADPFNQNFPYFKRFAMFLVATGQSSVYAG
jgi:hypothetical protein